MTDTTRCRIAIVDDEPSMCRALQRLLRLAGYDAETYASGEAFLESLGAGIPDYVILDLHMPGLTGFDVQATLARGRVAVPVVVITGHDSPAARERALAGGAVAYLRKPVSEDALLAALDRCGDGAARDRTPDGLPAREGDGTPRGEPTP